MKYEAFMNSFKETFQKSKQRLLIALLTAFSISSCTFEKAVPLPAGCTTTMYYSTDIKPFIDSKCVTCHSNVPSYMNGGDFSSFSLFKEKIDDGSVACRVKGGRQQSG